MQSQRNITAAYLVIRTLKIYAASPFRLENQKNSKPVNLKRSFGLNVGIAMPFTLEYIEKHEFNIKSNAESIVLCSPFQLQKSISSANAFQSIKSILNKQQQC